MRWTASLAPALRFAGALALGVACVTSAYADASALSPSEARQWLQRVHAAAHARNYQGVLVFSADGVLSSSRVAHFSDGRRSFERVETLDGTAQVTYRLDDRVYSLWPKSKLAVIEDRDPSQGSLRRVIEPRAEQHYVLSLQGQDRVAGRDAQVLLLQPRDSYRFAQRLWVDTQTGLLLRADVLGAKHRVLESSAFSEVAIDVKPKPESVLQPISHLQGWHIVRPAQDNTRLDAEGWALRAAVPGFVLASCSRRMLDATAPAALHESAAPALQVVFSDGLTHVSVFVEALDPSRHRQALLAHSGAMNTLMQRYGNDWWITVMGDVPVDTLKQFFAALERQP